MKSLVISLELFKQFNQQLLADLQKAKATNNKKQQSRLLLQNSAFVYEVVDIIIEFIKDFELGGVNDIIALHQDILTDLDRNEADDKQLKSRINTAGELSQTEIRVIADIENRQKFRQECKDKWSGFLDNIGQSQLQVEKYRLRINELELIRDNAKGQLGILHILTSMQMINDNLQTIDQLLEIDDLELATISESEFSSLLNIGVSKSLH